MLAACACTGSTAGDDDDGVTSPTATPTVSPTPTVTPTPTPAGSGGIRAYVSCTGSACRRGALRTVVYDCMTADTVVVASSGVVTLVETTSVTVSIGSLPAPALDCLHAIVDDTAGGTAVTGFDPQVSVVSDTTASAILVIDTPAK